MKHAIAPERFAPVPRSESRNRSQPFVAARAPCARQLKLRRVPAVVHRLPAGRKAGLIVVRFAHGALEAKACLRLLPRNRNSWFPHATAPLRGAALATGKPPSMIDLPWRARSRILGGAVAVSHQLDLISSRLARRIRPANPTRSGRRRPSGHPVNPSIITRMRRPAPGCFLRGQRRADISAGRRRLEFRQSTQVESSRSRIDSWIRGPTTAGRSCWKTRSATFPRRFAFRGFGDAYPFGLLRNPAAVQSVAATQRQLSRCSQVRDEWILFKIPVDMIFKTMVIVLS